MQRALLIAIAVMAGCGGDARVELSAADAIRAVAVQMDQAVVEYHREVCRYDDTREAELVAAFIGRVRREKEDEAALDRHSADLARALTRVRADRETEWTRRAAAGENVKVLREIAQGLERIGLQSLSLQDEMRRYLETWMQAQRRASGARGAAGGISTDNQGQAEVTGNGG